MYIVKVLKRKDAASIIVAVLLAMIVFNILPNYTGELADWLSGTNNFVAVSSEWQSMYMYPAVLMLVQLVFLEVFLRLAIAVRDVLVRRK